MAKNFFLKKIKKEILCIIPARGGSKSIKNKNIVKIKSKSLINYTIDTSIKLKKYCDAILKNRGGFGAVRELSERLLKGTKLLRSIEKEGFSELNS